MYYNVNFEACSAVMLLVFTIFARISNPLKTPQNTAYFRLAAIIIITCADDAATAYITNLIYDGLDFPIPIAYVLNSLYFILVAVSDYISTIYIGTILGKDKMLSKKFMFYSAIPAAIQIIISITDPFTGLIFYFSDDKKYLFGRFHNFPMIISGIYILYGLYMLFRERKQLSKIQYYTAVVYNFSAVLGIIIQCVFFPDNLLSFAVVSMAIIMIYFSLQTPDSYELIKLMAELKSEKERAEAASSAKEKFLAQMSHEMRTPVNGMLGMNEMILRKSNDGEIIEYAELIRSSGKFLISFINNILDYTKLSSGDVKLLNSPYSTRTFLVGLYEALMSSRGSKSIKTSVSFDKQIPSELCGDETRIKQVLNCLISNAAEYTQKGFINLSVTVKAITDKTVTINFSVADSGTGINKDNINRVAESFVRLEENGNKHSAGLGLTIVSMLLKLMNSKLEIESELGKGSIFSFDLVQQITDSVPLGQTAENIAATGNSNPSKTYFTAPEARILVVDDSEINLFVMQKLLEQMNIQADIAATGTQCLEDAADKPYDIIFLDHMMPSPDGIETFHSLKRMENCASRGAAIIILTANAVVGAKEKYLAEGFDDYMSKPVDYTELERIVVKHLPTNLVKRVDTPVEKTPITSEKGFAQADFSVLNTKTGMKYCRGNPEMYRSLLSIYAAQAQEYIKRLETDISSRNMEDYAIAAHSIKSSSKNIGAEKLSNLAKLQEVFAKQNNPTEVLSVHGLFVDTLGDVIEEIQRCLSAEASITVQIQSGTEEKDPVTEITVSELSKILESVNDRLYYFDDKNARTELAKLHTISCRGEVCRERAEKITARLDVFDTDGAIAIVHGWLTELAEYK